MLSTKVNGAKAGTVDTDMLRDHFADGLHPPSLRRDIRRFVRDHDGVNFQQARAEALRWMREDSEVEMRAEPIQVVPSHDKCRELHKLRTQIAASTAKMEALQAALQHLQAPGVQPLPFITGAGSPATYNESVKPDGCTNSNSEASSTQTSKIVP